MNPGAHKQMFLERLLQLTESMFGDVGDDL